MKFDSKWGYGCSCHHFGTRSRPYNKQTDAKPKADLFVDPRLIDVLTKRSSAFAPSVQAQGPRPTYASLGRATRNPMTTS